MCDDTARNDKRGIRRAFDIHSIGMVAVFDRFLDRGMYDVAEAALYARVSTQLASRWMFGSGAGTSALRRELQSPQGEKLVTFADFVQILSVRQLRTRPQGAVPLAKVRQAVDFLHERYWMDYPFARRHTLYTFQREIVYRHPEHGLLFVTGREVDQSLIHQVVEPHLEQLSYGSDGVACEFRIHEEEGVKIVMRPGIMFGEPVLPSGHTARTLWEAVDYEGGFDEAAKA